MRYGTLVILLALAAPLHAAPPKGVFPGSLKVGAHQLKLNGKGLLEWGVFQVDLYWGALYLEKPSKDPKRILKKEQAYRMHLYFVRELTSVQLMKAWDAAFKANAGKDLKKYRGRLNRLKRMMQTIGEGQSMRFTYTPGKGLAVTVAGKKRGTIPGGDFGQMFLRLYLGDHPPTKSLKKALLGRA